MKLLFSFNRIMGKCLAVLVLLFISLQPLVAQTAADEIETLLGTAVVNYAQASRFVLEAADLAAIANPNEAFDYAAERKWLPKEATAQTEACFNGISLLLMRSFEIKGGLLYSLFKNPHYAYRELIYKDIIQGRSDPLMAVSGSELLFLVSRVLSIKEEFDEPVSDGASLKLDSQRQKELAMQEAERMEQIRTTEAQRFAEQEALASRINTQIRELAIQDTSARVTSEGVSIRLSNIQFYANSAILAEQEILKLREISGIISGIKERNILIAGHSALAGTAVGQKELSQERAQTVADYLVSLGSRRTGEITVQGFGAERPVAANSTASGRSQNRRVEITILEN